MGRGKTRLYVSLILCNEYICIAKEEVMVTHLQNDKILLDSAGGFRVMCPACKIHHRFLPVSSVDRGPKWEILSINPLTISPSLLVQYYQASEEGLRMMNERIPPPDGDRYPGIDVKCHSYIRNGYWEFLGDCTHDMKNKKVPMITVQ